VETTHAIELNRSQKDEYDNLQAFLACKIGDEVVSFDEGQKFSKLQTLCDGFVYVQDEETEERHAVRADWSDKLQAVADMCEVMHERGERVLLFYSFIEERKWLVELLTAKGLIVADAKDKDFIKTWNEGKCDILTAHPASAGHGLNLQYGGRVIVWSSLTYNYELFAQANARLARQGQTRQTLIHYFVAKDTVEEQMVKALQRKSREQANFLQLTK
jgi:SNF2 family DNA or RNA helicase